MKRVMVNIIGLLLVFCAEARSQPDTTLKSARHLIFLEVLGTGGYASVNYELGVFNRDRCSIGIRGGVGSYHVMDYRDKFNPDLIFPVGFDFLYGGRHHIETGIGETVVNNVCSDMHLTRPVRRTSLNTTFTLGYRYQNSVRGGFVFRCAYTPIIEDNRRFLHWAGISFGYAFK